MKYKGRDVFIWKGSSVEDAKPIALSTSCDIEISADFKERAPVLDGRAKEHIAGRYSWQISCDCIVSDNNEMEGFVEHVKKGTKVFVFLGAGLPHGGPCRGFFGEALVQSVNEGAPLAGMATWKISMLGTGPLTPLVEE